MPSEADGQLSWSKCPGIGLVDFCIAVFVYLCFCICVQGGGLSGLINIGKSPGRKLEEFSAN